MMRQMEGSTLAPLLRVVFYAIFQISTDLVFLPAVWHWLVKWLPEDELSQYLWEFDFAWNHHGNQLLHCNLVKIFEYSDCFDLIELLLLHCWFQLRYHNHRCQQNNLQLENIIIIVIIMSQISKTLLKSWAQSISSFLSTK